MRERLVSAMHRAATVVREAAARPEGAAALALLAAATLALAVPLYLALNAHLAFACRAEPAAIGWVAVHGYAKPQELARLLLAPAAVCLAAVPHILAVAGGWWLVRRRGDPSAWALARFAAGAAWFPVLALALPSTLAAASAVSPTPGGWPVFETVAGAAAWLLLHPLSVAAEVLATLGSPLALYAVLAGWTWLAALWLECRPRPGLAPGHAADDSPPADTPVLEAGSVAGFAIALALLRWAGGPTPVGTALVVLALAAGAGAALALAAAGRLRGSHSPDTVGRAVVAGAAGLALAAVGGFDVSLTPWVGLGAAAVGGLAAWFCLGPGARADAGSRAGRLARRLPGLLLGAAVCLVAASWTYRPAFADIDLFHGGEAIMPAWRLVHSHELPYRDVYILHGLLQDGGVAWLSWLLHGEQTLEAYARGLRWIVTVPWALLALLLWFLSRRVWVALGVVLFLYHGHFLSPLRSVGPLLALCLAVRFLLCGPSRGRAAALGAVAMASLLAALDYGLYLLGALAGLAAVYLLAGGEFEVRRGERCRQVLAAAVGALAVVVGFWLWTGASFGAVGAWLSTAFGEVLPLQDWVWGLATPPPLPGPEAGTTVAGILGFYLTRREGVLVLVPALACAWAVAVVVRAVRGRLGRLDWALSVCALFLFCAYRSQIGRTGAAAWTHRIEGEYAYLVLATVALALLLRRPAVLRAAVPTFAESEPGRDLRLYGLGLATLSFLAVRGALEPSLDGLGFELRRAAEQVQAERALGEPLPLLGRARVVHVSPGLQAALQRYVDAHSAAGDPIFDFTNSGLLYALLDRRCPSRFTQAVFASSPAQQRELIAALEATPPRVVVYDSMFALNAPDGVHNHQRLPLVKAYLDRRYRLDTRIGGFGLWLPVPAGASPAAAVAPP